MIEKWSYRILKKKSKIRIINKNEEKNRLAIDLMYNSEDLLRLSLLMSLILSYIKNGIIIIPSNFKVSISVKYIR